MIRRINEVEREPHSQPRTGVSKGKTRLVETSSVCLDTPPSHGTFFWDRASNPGIDRQP